MPISQASRKPSVWNETFTLSVWNIVVQERRPNSRCAFMRSISHRILFNIHLCILFFMYSTFTYLTSMALAGTSCLFLCTVFECDGSYGHFTHETESPWPVNFKHSHWSKRRFIGPITFNFAAAKLKLKLCSRLVTANQGGQRNRNGKTTTVLFRHVFY